MVTLLSSFFSYCTCFYMYLLKGLGVGLFFVVPPEIRNVSSNQDICEGSLVTLSCNATGKPTPSITWTRVEANGSDSAPLPAVDGTYLINNITRSSNGTMYRCTAENGVGTVNRTVQVAVRCK